MINCIPKFIGINGAGFIGHVIQMHWIPFVRLTHDAYKILTKD